MRRFLIMLKVYLVKLVFTVDSEMYRRLPYVSIENGIVRGHLVRSDGFLYMSFLGIPYAAPPVGENRFKAPLPAAPWTGVLVANRTVQCPQSGAGDEDCLVINVFMPAPRRPASQRPLPLLPVLVFIHGGGFFTGSAPTYGVEYLLKRDILVVSFNYRIGVLGFLCLGTDEVPGNAGMKDQVAALRWVQRNIVHFGGHPRRVTIYGTGAGGASVDLQLLSKMSYGLFRSAIAESGASSSTWPITIDPIVSAVKLAETLDFIPRDLEDLTEFYKSKSAEELSVANAAYSNGLTDGTFGFSPCIESTLLHASPFKTQFMSESPYDILKRGNYNRVPMMMVFSSLEGLFLKSTQYHELNYKERMENDFSYFLPADLFFEIDADRISLVDDIKNFYFGNKRISDDVIVEYLEYFGDSLILHGVLESAQHHSRRMPLYLMEFAYKGGMRQYDAFYNNITVAGHNAMYAHAFVKNRITNIADLKAVEKVAELITNFVKYDNPTPYTTTLLRVVWPRVGDPQKLTYLYFSDTLKVSEKPHWRRKRFWDSVYKLYRRPLIPVAPL